VKTSSLETKEEPMFELHPKGRGKKKKNDKIPVRQKELLFFFSFFMVLGLEPRAYTLSHSTSPIIVMGFFQDRVLPTTFLG
jgi:hypothetical protein